MKTQIANTVNQGFLRQPTLRRGQELLDHQCWVFGRDILSADGNLLVEHGFTQVRCPQGGLTQYELRNGLGENSHVFLWGFGTFFGGETEGLFLPRSGFTPFRTRGSVELHNKDYPPFVEESSNIELLLRGIEWFARYEDWISRKASEQYRMETLREFPRRTLERRDLAGRWRQLAHGISEDRIGYQDCLSKSISA